MYSCLTSKKKEFNVSDVIQHYSNHNLNECSNVSSSHTKSITFKCKTDLITSNDLQTKKNLWNQSQKNPSPNFLNVLGNLENKFSSSKNTTNNSTLLSLHISANESSIDATALDSFDDKNGEISNNRTMIKNWKNAKQLFIESPSAIQNPFEFPRQQSDKVSQPEVSQFRASQLLYNPNGTNSTTNEQNVDSNEIVIEENVNESRSETASMAPMLNLLKQSDVHLQGDPNKTVLLQGEDGKTQVFVNSDEQFVRNHFGNGKSFEDIGDGKKEIEFELPFRLHKDSTTMISTAGGSLSPAIPAITYHNHVWWYWTYDLSFKDDNGVIKASFTLKSIGPNDHPTAELPRGALGENIPRTQAAPKLKNPILYIGEKTFKLSTVLGTPDQSYCILDFITLDEFRSNFTEESPFLSLNITCVIPVSYFDVENLAGFNQPITDIVPKNVSQTLEKIIKGEKVNGADFVLTFGDSSKNDSVEFFVHRAALARTSSLLGQIFVTKMNPPGDQILVPTAEDRFIFPHLRPQDAQFFLTYFYTQQITLPHFGAFARIGRVFCMVAERPQVFHLFKQWQRLLVERLLNAKKNTKDDSKEVIEESVKALIGIYSAPYGGLPVAKRVAASLLADKINQYESNSKNLVADLRENPNFKQYDLEKFLPGVVRLQHYISAVKKNGI